MPGPSDPARIRPPAVAGRFYPADPVACRTEAQSYLKPDPSAAQTWIGGVVPHAGWICSGAVAGQTIATMAEHVKPDVIVVFGAIHTPMRVHYAALDANQRWSLPGGESELPQAMQQKLLEQKALFAVEPRLHAQEHAVEVEVPLLQLAFPNIPILPLEVPPFELAEPIGRQTAQILAQAGLKAIFLASTDFTHYGPNYGFVPAGVGPAAMQWVKDNDKRMLDLIVQLASDKIVPEVRQRYNACGAGAIAAMLAACREMGAKSAQILRHTNSYETLAKVHPQPPTNAVGYAAVVVG